MAPAEVSQCAFGCGVENCDLAVVFPDVKVPDSTRRSLAARLAEHARRRCGVVIAG